MFLPAAMWGLALRLWRTGSDSNGAIYHLGGSTLFNLCVVLQ